MPTIQIGMYPGRTLDQKRDLVRGVTQAVCDALGVDPDAVRITIIENELQNVARGGVLRSDSPATSPPSEPSANDSGVPRVAGEA